MPLDPNTPVQLSAGDVGRLSRSNRRTERLDAARYNGADPIERGPRATFNLRSVRITGSDSLGSPGLYPAVVLLFDKYDGANAIWADLPGSQCWVVAGPDGGKLMPGKYVDALLVGEYGGAPIFAVQSPVAAFRPYSLGMPCLVTNPSTGAITGLKQVWVIDAIGTTECRAAGTCPAGYTVTTGCPPVYYCADGLIVSQSPGAPPAGTVVTGPWATRLEASANCHAPLVSTPCCGGRMLPGVLHVAVTAKSGSYATLPDAFDITYNAGVSAWENNDAWPGCAVSGFPIRFAMGCDGTVFGSNILVGNWAVTNGRTLCNSPVLLTFTAGATTNCCGAPGSSCTGSATLTVTE